MVKVSTFVYFEHRWSMFIILTVVAFFPTWKLSLYRTRRNYIVGIILEARNLANSYFQSSTLLFNIPYDSLNRSVNSTSWISFTGSRESKHEIRLIIRRKKSLVIIWNYAAAVLIQHNPLQWYESCLKRTASLHWLSIIDILRTRSWNLELRTSLFTDDVHACKT